MTRTPRLSALALLSLAGSLFFGCASDEWSGPTLVLGSVLDSSGNLATPSWTVVAQLAVRHANVALKNAGRPFRFKLLSADSTNTPTTIVSRALDFVRNEGAKAIITDSSQDDIALNQTHYDNDSSNDPNVPIICMACTSPAINNPNAANPRDAANQAALRNSLGWNFRTVMDTFPQSRVLINLWLAKGQNGDINKDGQAKNTIYASDEAFGRGFAGVLQSSTLALHPTPPAIVNTYYHPPALDPNTYDWGSDIAKLISPYSQSSNAHDFRPDVIIEATFPQYAGALVKSFVTSGASDTLLLHTHAARLPAALNSSGWALNGQEGTSHVLFDDNPSGLVFRDELERQTGVQPIFLDAHTYDATLVLVLASLVAGRSLPDPTQVSGAQIRDALRTINDPRGTVIRTGPAELEKALGLIASGQPINYEGASGPVDFDANNNVKNVIVHWRVENERFVDLERYDCISSSLCPRFP
ncbi:MAG: ABC transporter substrate-binding protein [Myxococcales bacterium]|nr:ABC transporter substrate-binding protein [Myxococcales bacterium]